MRLAAFAGVWRLDRVVEDVRAGRSGRLVGTARFDPGRDGLAYLEEGLLRYGDAPPMRAARRYLWSDGGAGQIEVRFEDGRFFHRFDAEEPEPAAVHDCPPDRYEVRYDFRAWPRWRAHWRVRGPGKDYAIVSSYLPLAAPDAPRGAGQVGGFPARRAHRSA